MLKKQMDSLLVPVILMEIIPWVFSQTSTTLTTVTTSTDLGGPTTTTDLGGAPIPNPCKIGPAGNKDWKYDPKKQTCWLWMTKEDEYLSNPDAFVSCRNMGANLASIHDDHDLDFIYKNQPDSAWNMKLLQSVTSNPIITAPTFRSVLELQDRQQIDLDDLQMKVQQILVHNWIDGRKKDIKKRPDNFTWLDWMWTDGTDPCYLDIHVNYCIDMQNDCMTIASIETTGGWQSELYCNFNGNDDINMPVKNCSTPRGYICKKYVSQCMRDNPDPSLPCDIPGYLDDERGCDENKDCKDGKQCLSYNKMDNTRKLGVCAKPCTKQIDCQSDGLRGTNCKKEGMSLGFCVAECRTDYDCASRKSCTNIKVDNKEWKICATKNAAPE